MTNTTSGNRSQSWFRPGRYVSVGYIRGVEVLPRSRGCVQLGGGTIHGTASELRALARQMLRAASLADQRPAA